MFDLVIRDALLLDGLDAPPRRGGVRIAGKAGTLDKHRLPGQLLREFAA